MFKLRYGEFGTKTLSEEAMVCDGINIVMWKDENGAINKS